MVLFDTTIALLLLSKNTPTPLDPTTGKQIEKAKERLDFLIHTLEQEDHTIVIPTPVLSELLVRAGRAGEGYLQIIARSSRFKIAPFDTRAAIELAIMSRNATAKGNKKGDSAASWNKVKFDRQIVAIGKTENVTAIYSDDKDLRALAKIHHMTPYGIADLPIPPSNLQTSLIDEIHRIADE